MFDYPWFRFAKGTRWVYRGVEEIGVLYLQRSVAGSNVRKEDRIRAIFNGFAIFRPEKNCHTPPLSVNKLVVAL